MRSLLLITVFGLVGCGGAGVDAVKSGYLFVDETISIGSAFDNRDVCLSTAWSQFDDSRGQAVVEYVCDVDVSGANDAKLEAADKLRLALERVKQQSSDERHMRSYLAKYSDFHAVYGRFLGAGNMLTAELIKQKQQILDKLPDGQAVYSCLDQFQGDDFVLLSHLNAEQASLERKRLVRYKREFSQYHKLLSGFEQRGYDFVDVADAWQCPERFVSFVESLRDSVNQVEPTLSNFVQRLELIDLTRLSEISKIKADLASLDDHVAESVQEFVRFSYSQQSSAIKVQSAGFKVLMQSGRELEISSSKLRTSEQIDFIYGNRGALLNSVEGPEFIIY